MGFTYKISSVMAKKLLIIFCFCMVNQMLVYAQKTGPFTDSMEMEIRQWSKINKVPAIAVGLINNDSILGTKVFIDSTIKRNSDQALLFSVASLTKPVSMMLALTLVSQGLWNLDEPLVHYWIDPDVKGDTLAQRLTTRHVLSHQGGFVNWRSMNPNGKLKFDTTPGTTFRYSGEGFEYLRRALEHKFKQSFDTLVATYVFKPLKMHSSYLTWNVHIDTLSYAGRYDQHGKKYATEKINVPNAAASLITSIEDYTRFALACLDGTGLSSEVARQMKTIQIKIPQAEHVGMGLSWAILEQLKSNEFALMHSGSDPGIKTLIVLLPKSKRGVVIFTNGDNGKVIYENILKNTLDLGEEILLRMNKK